MGLLPFLLIAATLSLHAATLEDAARDLTRRMAPSLSPREPLTLSVQTLVGHSIADIQIVRRVFTQALGNRLRLPADQRSSISVTLSQNPQSHLLIVELRGTDDSSSVWMATFETASNEGTANPAVQLERRLLRQQDARLLDLVQTPKGLLTLDGREIALHSQNPVRRLETFALPENTPQSRDLRGRLVVENSTFTAFLPGLTCRGMLDPQWRVSCDTVSTPFLIAPEVMAGFVLQRNFFQHDRFGYVFSVAVIDGQYVIAPAAAKPKLLDSDFQPLAILPTLGSDFAAACGNALLTVTNSTTLQVLQLHERQLRPASDPIDLPGVITALWPSTEPDTFLAITKDTTYAAHLVTARCSR